MNNNDLDKLFQEQLNELEASPNQSVWTNIESKLNKKKRKIVPFWWYSSGVAALLILGIFLYPYFKGEQKLKTPKNDIILSNSESTENSKNNNNKNIDSITKTTHEKKEVILTKITNKSEKENKNDLLKEEKQPENLKNKRVKKEIVSPKNAMKKIFLADNINNIKQKNKVKNEQKKEKNIYQNSDEFSLKSKKEKNRTTVSKKEAIKKLDFIKTVQQKDSVFSISNEKSKWSVAPTFAVLNSNSFTNTSPINEDLANSTKGQNSISYGLQIGYRLNAKWSIQSGIYLQETRYRNNNITASNTLSTRQSNISFNNGKTVALATNNNISNTDSTENSLLNSTIATGNLTQNYGYLEIPIEVKYNIYSSNKFNSEIVGGFSSLFLNKNEINLNTGFNNNTGIAENLNTVNFSGNFGFDFNYLISKKWSFHLNPMFKVQLNTFSQNANGFSPFQIGAYTGLRYRF